jgi:predicted AAA+ superfamily ATPase
MRRFSSYGPLNTKLHYYAPRKSLIHRAYTQLIGESPSEGGHCITVWAPRQCGKTWIMQEIVEKIKQTDQYEVGIISMERTKKVKNEKKS